MLLAILLAWPACGFLGLLNFQEGSGEPTVAPAVEIKVQLSTRAFPDGVADEAGYESWLADEAARVKGMAEQAQTSVEKSKASLGAANFILARQLEPILSRRLLKLSVAEDGARAIDLAEQARQQVERASQALEALEAEPDHSEEHAKELRSQFEALKAFAEAARILFADGRSEESGDARSSNPEDEQQACRKAVSDLAVIAEVADAELASACVLWQALLLEYGGLHERLWTVLPEPLSNPRCRDCTWPFFARLLRCRLLCESPTGPKDGCITAWVLGMELEEAATEWFGNPAAREEARRAAAWSRLQWLQTWEISVGPEAKQSEMQWFQTARERVRQQYFSVQSGPDATPLLRLGLAMPMLVPIEEAASPPQAVPSPDPQINGDMQK